MAFLHHLISVVLLLIVIIIVILIVHFNKKRKTSTIKKGIYIGFYIGLLWMIIGGAGLVKCNWNLEKLTLIPQGVCGAPLTFYTFYLPLVPGQVTLVLFYWLLDLLKASLSYIVVYMTLLTIIELIYFSAIGALVGYIIKKTKKK